ncbi:pur operon repressor, partial [Streptococcus suis]|nr:pur operon repressor [Streptococcus suis]
GVVFTPSISKAESVENAQALRDQMAESNRIFPGGYIYSTDLLSTPQILKNVGRIIANAFKEEKIDAVITVATKGVTLA